ncbi:MAG: GNAT family N-acetyltransferase [Propionibacteriales bacterium]|nr:GNAT family N-acetyltransferase [Propionibacteriales bacterium]
MRFVSAHPPARPMASVPIFGCLARRGGVHLLIVGIDVYAPEEYDQSLASDLVTLLNAASNVDSPHMPPRHPRSHLLEMLHGWDEDGPERVLTLRDAAGQLVGAADVHVSQWEDNQHMAHVDVTVHPDHRRSGHGSTLLDAVTGLARDWGKTLTSCEAWADSSGEGFAAYHGYKPGMRSAQRRLDLAALDWGQIDELHAEAADKATAYELVSIVGRAPEALIPDLVAVTAAINDAPLDDLEWEDEIYSVDRVRAFETAQAARERRLYRLLARRIEDGGCAGHTVVAVDPRRPSYGNQMDTTVLVEHRGNRLGLLLKTAMLRWLRETEPQLDLIDTWNAESNTHMIAVNDRLGCFVVARGGIWQRRL